MVDRVLHLFKPDAGECERRRFSFFFEEEEEEEEAGNVNEA